MLARIKNFKTDFTLFLEDEKTRHLVKVVTDDKIIECSGVILSQHSEKLREMIQEDEELFLQGYESANSLLTILHGGAVILTMDNCLEIIKFAWEFGIPYIAEQAFNFLESVTHERNFGAPLKICLDANKMEKLFDVKTEQDAFWPIENVIREFTTQNLERVVNRMKPTDVAQMFKNKDIVAVVMGPLSKRIDKKNVKGIVKVLQDIDYAKLVAATSSCSKDDAKLFFEAVEKFSVTRSSKQFLQNLKSLIFREIENSCLASVATLPDVNSILLRLWKTYDSSQMLWVCQQNIAGFPLMETILSWVSLFKPSKAIVKKLCRFINPSRLCLKYMKHAISIFNILGYEQKFDLRNCLDRNEFYRISVKNITMIPGIPAYPHQSMDKNIIVYRKELMFSCVEKNRGETEGRYLFTVAPNEISRLSHIPVYVAASTSMPIPMPSHFVYAKTVEGRHVPFYTDPQLAAEMNYDLKSIGITKSVAQNVMVGALQPKRARIS